MTSADIAKRFANDRPGFELVHFEDVALPYYRLVLDALIQERKPIGPVEEFVLRGIDAGLDQIDDLCGLLGLERQVVEQAVVALNQVDNVDYRLEGESRVLRITPLGTRALSGWKEMIPVREEVLIGFDRLTWTPTGRHYRSLLRPRDARDMGLTLLPPRLKKRLRPADVDLDLAQRALETIARKSLTDASVIAIKDVGNHQMFLRGLALVYAAESGEDQQVAIAIDGRISEEHETSFASIDGPSRSGLTVDGPAPEDERPQLPDGAEMSPDSERVVVDLERRIATATASVHRARTMTATAEAASGDTLDSEQDRDELVADLEKAQADLAALPVRSIQTFEHRALLEEALDSADRRLLIISPWMRGDVVNANFTGRLRSRLNAGASVHIGWGIGDEDDERGRQPLKLLERVERDFSSFVLRRLGNTHAKILIWDDNLVVTSFNWLSFRGDRKRTFRQEEGILISTAGLVDEEYKKYRSQITAADHSG